MLVALVDGEKRNGAAHGQFSHYYYCLGIEVTVLSAINIVARRVHIQLFRALLLQVEQRLFEKLQASISVLDSLLLLIRAFFGDRSAARLRHSRGRHGRFVRSLDLTLSRPRPHTDHRVR